MKNCMRISVVLLLAFFTLLMSCGFAKQEESDIDYGLASDEEQRLFEKKRTLALLLELPYPLSSYDEESARAYKEIADEVSKALHNIGSTEEADSYIKRMREVISSMRLTAGELTQVYIKAEGSIGDSYGDAEITIIDTNGKQQTGGTPAAIKLRGNSTRARRKTIHIKLRAPYHTRYGEKQKVGAACKRV